MLGLFVICGLAFVWLTRKTRTTSADVHAHSSAAPLAMPATDALPAQRPIVIPTGYGRSADGYAGLFVKNEGEPAFDVSIPGIIPIGHSKMSSWNALPHFDKADGEKLFDVQIEMGNGVGTFGTGLRDELIRANREAVEVPIRYKDFNNQWYLTICSLERHFQLGIYARFVRQELAPPPIEDVPSKLALSSEDPRIYLEPNNDEFIPSGKMPFVVENRGGDVAHDVQFAPLVIGKKTVTFGKLGQLDRNKPQTIFPHVDSSSPFFHDNIVSPLGDAWNEQGDLAEEFPFQIVIDYSNFSGERRFQALVQMTYLPFAERIAVRGAFANPRKPVQIVRVDKTEFRRLA